MSCKDLKPPTPPSVTLPGGVKMPNGQSASGFTNAAGGGGLSTAMNNAQDMVSSNLKNLGAALSPKALAGKIDDAVTGIAGTITDTVKGAIDGVTNLKNRLQGMSGGDTSKVKGSITAKIGGVGEFSAISATIKNNKCADQYAKQAGQTNKGIKDAANGAVAGLSNSERAAAMKDPQKMAELQSSTEAKVTESAKANASAAATTQDKSTRSSQEKIQSNNLNPVSADPRSADAFLKIWFTEEQVISVMDSYLYYLMQIYSRPNDFQKFGFFGISNSDAKNALNAVKAVAEEVVISQWVVAYTKFIQMSADENHEEVPMYTSYPELQDLANKLKLNSVTDKNTGKTMEQTLSEIRSMFDKTYAISPMAYVNTYNDSIPVYREDLAKWFVDHMLTTDLDAHDYRKLSTTGENPLPFPDQFTTVKWMWGSKNDGSGPMARNNFKEVLTKKKDWIESTIQKEKESVVDFFEDQKSILDDPMLINRIKDTYDDPTRFLFRASPYKIGAWARYVVQVRWDPVTGDVTSVHRVGGYTSVERTFLKNGVDVWEKNSFFENTLN